MIGPTERLKLNSEPHKVRIESEPYVRFVGRAFCPVINIYDIKKRREYFLIVGAQSLSMALKKIQENEGKLTGIEMWVNKASDDRAAKYEVELA